jgi:hypothetical protein
MSSAAGRADGAHTPHVVASQPQPVSGARSPGRGRTKASNASVIGAEMVSA